ncbi:MAG: potassium-transporting ATPase subunit C [Planctomycetes bacterium SCN 63-9]|nr:MAG: potassium-transporting ATPase subunit C [Planctomycetes bacterium SCN 63-9]
MLGQLRTAILMLLVLTILTGGIYPLVVTGIAQFVFPHQAEGSLIKNGEAVIGSDLIGQPFADPKYVWGRLSATSPVPYHAAASGGSNYGPLHPGLRAAAESRIAALTADGTPARSIPVDLVTASGSGLDPHISPAAAEFQVARVAKARGFSEDRVRSLILANTQGRLFGILGEPRVHVLRLNLALDQQQ